MANTLKKVTASSFGSVSSVSAKGRDKVPESVYALTPGQAGENIHRLKNRLDAVTAPSANWINVLNDQPDQMELLKQRQLYFEQQGIWSI